jgi:hypothetical protein
MKSLKLISTATLLLLSLVSFSQTAAPGGTGKKEVFFVQSTHTPEQCVTTLTDMKSKGDAFLTKFEFGCMSGDHTAYAFLEGTSESDVRQMLPKDLQANAKIKKVDKFTGDQIEKIHKDHMKSDVKK